METSLQSKSVFQNLAQLKAEDDDDIQCFSHRDQSLVKTTKQIQSITQRVNKQPKGLSSFEFDALFKIVLIGESSTGKTSLLLRFTENTFDDNYHCTIGVDFKIRTMQVDNRTVKLQIWDTAGQERFKSISQAYYRNSHGCIAMYDISNKQSFEAIIEQVNNFVAYTSKDYARNIILVGNKTDLEYQRQVNFEDAVQLAKQLNLAGCLETSAKDNSQVDEAFFVAVSNAMDQKNRLEGGLQHVSEDKKRPRLQSEVPQQNRQSMISQFSDSSSPRPQFGDSSMDALQYKNEKRTKLSKASITKQQTRRDGVSCCN